MEGERCVLSRNKVTSINLEELFQIMKRLNKRKIRWIIREIEKRELSVYRIAKQQKISKMRGVQHIMGRVKHPQSNGKLERLVYTMKDLLNKFDGNLEKAVKFYNEERPHMSLENGRLRTPLQAFYEKKRNN